MTTLDTVVGYPYRAIAERPQDGWLTRALRALGMRLPTWYRWRRWAEGGAWELRAWCALPGAPEAWKRPQEPFRFMECVTAREVYP